MSGRWIWRRRFLTGGLVVMAMVAVTSGYLSYHPAGALQVSPGQQQIEALPLDELQVLEQRLLEDILRLDLQLEQARVTEANLRQAIRSLEQKRMDNQAVLAKETERLNEKRSQLVNWLRLYHRAGPLSYLGVLLEATDAMDFLTRIELVSILIDRQLGLLTEVESLVAGSRNREALMAAQATDLVVKETQAGEVIQRTKELMESKNLALETARKAEGGARIIAMEKQWSAAMPSLNYFLANFANLPWSSIQPDQIEIGTGLNQVLVGISQEALNRVLAADPGLAGVIFQVSTGGIDISGSGKGLSGQPAGYKLSGQLQAEGQSLRLEPQSLKVEGIELGPEVLSRLLQGYNLSFGMPDVLEAFHLSLDSVKTEAGKINLFLKPRAGQLPIRLF